MKMFFSSRQKMRAASFGQQHDQGKLATKRWARDLQDQIKTDGVDKRLTTCENAKGEQVTVIVYKSKMI